MAPPFIPVSIPIHYYFSQIFINDFFHEGTILYEHFDEVTIQGSCENDHKYAKGCALNSVEVYSQETWVKRDSYCC